MMIARGAKKLSDKFDALQKAGPGKYTITAELVPMAGGGQMMILTDFAKTTYK